MSLPRRQRGFIQYLAGALIVLALAGRFAWWVATEESFTEVAVVLWAIGYVIAYMISADQFQVLRVPAGFGVFALIGLASLPLSWLAESRIALIVLLAAQLAFSFRAGAAISSRMKARGLSRYPEGAGDAALRRGGDLVADFARWALLAFVALMAFLIAPLIVFLVVTAMVDLSQQDMKWLAALWGLAGTAWFGFKTGATRWQRLPACAWIYLLVTSGIFAADLVAGPFAAGTGVQVAYITMPGALVAAFVEVFVFGAGGLMLDGGRQTRDGE